MQVGFTHHIPLGTQYGNCAVQLSATQAVSAKEARRGQFATQGVVYGDFWKTEKIETTYDTGCDKQVL